MALFRKNSGFALDKNNRVYFEKIQILLLTKINGFILRKFRKINFIFFLKISFTSDLRCHTPVR